MYCIPVFLVGIVAGGVIATHMAVKAIKEVDTAETEEAIRKLDEVLRWK